jgi:hypothetical protein
MEASLACHELLSPMNENRMSVLHEGIACVGIPDAVIQ